MQPDIVHIIGAGMAGLASAVRLARRGAAIVIHEATDQAGGRCRSYDDRVTGMRIDNGTHILLSGNKSALDFIAGIGALSLVSGAPAARFPFIDLATQERWTLDLGHGRLPLWVFDRHRRAPGTRALDYLPLVSVLRSSPGRALGEVMRCSGRAYERVVQPFLLAALNVDPRAASADLARAVVRETIAAGGAACRPYLAPQGLSAAFVEPALALLRRHNGTIRFGRQLRRFVLAEDRIVGLDFGDDVVPVGPAAAVILAVPPYVAGTIVPDLRTPSEYCAIINAHFRIAPPPRMNAMTGVLGGTAEWIFAFEDRISVTISDAGRLLERTRDDLAAIIWQDVQRVGQISDELPPWQIVRERRATFAATPEQNAKRPGARTMWRNLALAGDWTDTGLPATIESAIRSGNRAADLTWQA